MNKRYPVIDLFAGPGGLAEGFSSVLENEERVFKVGLSVEKDIFAHQTLELRSFVRQFPPGRIPKEYYSAVKDQDIIRREKSLSALFSKYPQEYLNAQKEAFLHELGKDSTQELDNRISNIIGDNKDWVLIGGPPCQAYSLAGRSRVGGISEDDHRVFLYKEYLRVLFKFQPAIFVMENVKGLLSAKVQGKSVFEMILEDLKKPFRVFNTDSGAEYTIHSLVKKDITNSKDFLIKSEDYGIPQKRHRVILLGIRNDVSVEPPTLTKSKQQFSISDVIDDLPEIRSKLNRKFSNYTHSKSNVTTKRRRQYENVLDSYEAWGHIFERHLDEITELNGLKHFGANYALKKLSLGSEYLPVKTVSLKNKSLNQWYLDSKLSGVLNHESRSHLVEDLKRYLFAAIYSDINSVSPKLVDYKKYSRELLPDHHNAETGKFNDRFRVQIKDSPASTITSHISKDGHYFIHYDAEQNRSLTVREAARIQTFPDNYLFRGSRTHQYHQVGNAVPPYLAYQIGQIVSKILQYV